MEIRNWILEIIEGMLSSSKPGLLFGVSAFALAAFGLIILASASADSAYQKFGSAYYLLTHQVLYGFLPGLFLFFLFWRIDYLKWKRLSKLIFFILMASLVAVLIPGVGESLNRAKSWIVFGGVSIQPSEFAKLGLIIFLAWLLAKFGQTPSFSPRIPHSHASEGTGGVREGIKDFRKGFLLYFLFPGAVCGLILLQPDMGTAFLIGLIAATMFFLAGGRILHLSILAAAGVAAIGALIKIAPYRMARITTFLNPSFDPQGIGYHINQALIAIGSGGFWGLGLGNSRQKYQYLPEVIGDSVFAIMGEELGFLLCAIFIFCFFLFLWQGFKIAAGAKDKFGYYLACGVVIWFGWQMILNVGSMIGILPLTGLTLPFISYGGSSLTASMAAAGLMLNIARHNKQNFVNHYWTS